MTRSTLLLGLCAFGLCAAPLHANEAERLANLSKSAFLAEYEDHFIQSLALSEELMRRFNPDYASIIDTKTPITDAERAVFECLYDTLSGQGALAELADQSMASDQLMARIETDPDFDYVDMMDPALENEVTGLIPGDTLSAAMDTCGSMTLAAERMSFSNDFWTDMQAAALERGYIETQ